MSPGSRSLHTSSSFTRRACLHRSALRLGTPNVSRFRGLLVHHRYDELLASLPEAFTPELSTDRSPSPLPGMTTVATGQFPPAGLSPAGPAASVAAPRTELHQRNSRGAVTLIAGPHGTQRGGRCDQVRMKVSSHNVRDMRHQWSSRPCSDVREARGRK
jgi:hypothetical protein